MDIADQFQKIRVLFADDGFVSVLEKMSRAFVALIKCYSIAGHQAAHYFAQRCGANSQKEVEMVGNAIMGDVGRFVRLFQTLPYFR